tara:strand:+ start:242 stop:1120 length:879 start_codon:yes stop_codon:yes gene_type:complete
MTDSEPSTLSEKLNLTKKRLGILSKKVASSTKSMVENTNNSIKTTISEQKEKRQQKKQEKLNKTKTDLSEAGLLDDVPSMITLPEFENERMEIASEQNDTMITIVEEMQRLSERIDHLERRHKAITTNNKKSQQITTKEPEQKSEVNTTTSPVMGEVIHLLGASLVWIVVLFGADKFISERAILIMDSYPAEIPVWGIGAMTWSMYMLSRLGQSSNMLRLPKLLLFQTAAAVGITTSLGLMVYDETMTTVSSIWVWGTVIAIGLLLAASMIASVWQSTKNLVGITDEEEIID